MEPVSIQAEAEARRQESRDAERAAYVSAVVDKAPPLTDEQRSRISALLRRPAER